MTHSPEPWKVETMSASSDTTDDPGYSIRDANGNWLLNVICGVYESYSPDISKADLERIVACVNFCKGIPTDVLEKFLNPNHQAGMRIEVDGEVHLKGEIIR